MKRGKNAVKMSSSNNYDDAEFDDEFEAEMLEFGLVGYEIDKWINELKKLRIEGGSIVLDIDEENSLKINYDDESADGEEI